jgi:hypothetical protein
LRIAIHILIILLLFSGCKEAKRRKLESENGLKVRFEIVNFQEKMGDCDKQDGACAQIDMVYPVVVALLPMLI